MKRMEEKPMTNHQSDRMETLARIDELERLKETTDDERVIEKIKAKGILHPRTDYTLSVHRQWARQKQSSWL